MKLQLIATLAFCMLSLSICQNTNTTTLEIEDQINPSEILEIITAKDVEDTTTNVNVSDVTEIDEDEDAEEDTTSSMILNANNTIAKIVETVASNMTANIKPNMEEVPETLDLEAVLDKVGQQMFSGGPKIDQSPSQWIQSIPRNPLKKYIAFSEKNSSSEDNNIIKPCWYDQNSPTNQSEWIWITSALYELMNNFAIVQTNNSLCRKHSLQYIENVKNFTYWAMRMRDASVMSPVGLLDANFWQLGNFDECIELYVSQVDVPFQGKYCLPSLTFHPKKEYYPGFYTTDHSKDYWEFEYLRNAWEFFTPNIDPAKVPRDELHWAICIPSSCTTQDLQGSLQESFDQLSKKYPIEFQVKVEEKFCYDETERSYTTGFWIFMAFLVFMLSLVGFSTLYDVLIVRTEFFPVNPTLKTWTIPFSAATNIEKLVQNNDSEEFSVIHGLKAISIIQVVMGHRVMNFLGNVLDNPQFTEIRVKNPLWGYFNNGTLMVDNFFVIGGFLTYYYLFQELEDRKGKINFIVIYIYRILRITPVYMFVVAFYIFVLPLLNDGPLWDLIVLRETNRCRDNWWANLLYVNNYFQTDQQCMVQAWYLACDFHFFILGTIVVWIAWKFRKAALPLLIILMVGSLALPSLIVYQGNYWGHFRTYIPNMHDPSSEATFQNVYVKSHLRAFPYILGLFCGYLYIAAKAVNYKIPCAWKWGWVAYFVLTGHLPYVGSFIFYIPGRPYDALENAIFTSLQRLLWGPLIGFIIVGHATTRFGQASKTLGHRLWVPFGRLTFCAYLIHVVFQLMEIGSIRSPNHMSYTNITFGIFQDITLTFIGALFLNLLIESPLDRFQKKIVKKLMRGELNKKKKITESQSDMVKSPDLSSDLSLSYENSNVKV